LESALDWYKAGWNSFHGFHVKLSYVFCFFFQTTSFFFVNIAALPNVFIPKKTDLSQPSSFALIGFFLFFFLCMCYVRWYLKKNMFLVVPEPFSGAQKQFWPQNIICIRDTIKSHREQSCTSPGCRAPVLKIIRMRSMICAVEGKDLNKRKVRFL